MRWQRVHTMAACPSVSLQVVSDMLMCMCMCRRLSIICHADSVSVIDDMLMVLLVTLVYRH